MIHEHIFEQLWSDDHAEISEQDPVMHTAFKLLACAKCRVVEPFPRANYDLCTARYKAALVKALADKNWRLQ